MHVIGKLIRHLIINSSGIFKSTCKIDITWFPFDDQKCEMKVRFIYVTFSDISPQIYISMKF